MTRQPQETIAVRSAGRVHPEVAAFFEPVTETVTYVVREIGSPHCAVIDPVLEPVAGTGAPPTHAADEVIAYVRGNDLTVDWILETHTWADHLSAAHYLKRWIGGRIAIAPRVPAALGGLGCLSDRSAAGVYAMPGASERSGPPFDHLFANGERFRIGALEGVVLRPSEAPAHGPWTGYVIGDCAFVDDAAVADTFAAAARREQIALPGRQRLFACHDPARHANGMAG